MLSSRLLRQSARQLLPRHPIPSPQACPPPTRRGFHATAPRKDAVLDAFLVLPHELMAQIHNHLPWYATIPLTAFLFRGALVTTFGSRSRSLIARYIGLHPLRQALSHHTRHNLMLSGGYRNPKEAKKAIALEIRKKTSALDKRWDVTIWGQVNWTLAQIPIFLTMAELIRKMCNSQDGLLGMGLVGLGLKESQGAAGSLHGVDMSTPSYWFEPSLATEGMLWFPDLLAADPTGTLPFVVSALMFTNVYFTKNGTTNPENRSGFSKGLRRVLLGVSLLIGPLCQHLPAALLLYWSSSTASVIVWNWWLDWRYPAPRDFVACKRPLRILPASKSRRG